MTTLEEYTRKIEGKKCLLCGAELPAKVKYFPHKHGWEVEGFDRKQWLYVDCPACGYQNSLWKLGVER